MAHTTFDQAIYIAAAPAVVQEHLTHLMTNISGLQPFVIWSRHVQTITTADGERVDHYRVREHVKLGSAVLPITVKVDMCVTATGRLVSNAYQSPGIHLYNHTWCEPEGEGTRVCEHIEITAPRLLLKTTYNGAAAAHQEMFARLKAHIEHGLVPA
ncbi:MAG: SRPBCC family protein [Ktedonobacterales bacterium]